MRRGEEDNEDEDDYQAAISERGSRSVARSRDGTVGESDVIGSSDNDIIGGSDDGEGGGTFGHSDSGRQSGLEGFDEEFTESEEA